MFYIFGGPPISFYFLRYHQFPHVKNVTASSSQANPGPIPNPNLGDHGAAHDLHRHGLLVLDLLQPRVRLRAFLVAALVAAQ